MVMIESCSLDTGSFVIKSMLTTLNGAAFGVTIMGCSGAFGTFVHSLVL